MEKHALNSIIVLKVNISCCKECPEKLQKGLLTINGVYQVTLDQEKKLVSIRGNIDPFMLIEAIDRMEKSAELMFYDKEPKIEGHHHHKNAQCCGEKDPQKDDHHNQNFRHNGGHDHDHNHDYFVHKHIEEEDMYKDSNYGRMPFRESESLFGNHTGHYKQKYFGSQSSVYDTRNSNYSRWFREEALSSENAATARTPSSI